jgi:Mrp family chromosome partitioning ATPase
MSVAARDIPRLKCIHAPFRGSAPGKVRKLSYSERSMGAERDPSHPVVRPAWVTPPPSRPEQTAFSAYVNSIRAHLRLVLVVIAVAVGASVVWLAMRSPSYSATSEIFVSPLPQDEVAFLGVPVVRDAGDPTRTIQTAAALVDTRAAADAAAKQLGQPWTGEQVKGVVDVKPLGQTNILSITATAGSADLAAQIANVYATTALAVRKDLVQRLARQALPSLRARLKTLDAGSPGAAELQRQMNRLEALSRGPDPTLALAQRASAPSAPEGAPAYMVVALALLAGAVLGTGTALLIDTLTPDRVGTEEELLSLLPVPVLARLPRLKRRQRKLGMVEQNPTMREALRTVQVQLNLKGGRRRTVLITSPSPADGKTTTAVAFGMALADGGARVILIDADVRRAGPHSSAWRAQPPEATTQEPTAGARPTRPEAFGRLLRPVPDHPTLQLIDAGDLGLDSADERSLTRLIDILRRAAERADYVILDTPPLGVVSDALPLLEHADDVILVSKLRWTKRIHAEVTRELLGRAGIEPTGLLVIGEGTASPYPYYR